MKIYCKHCNKELKLNIHIDNSIAGYVHKNGHLLDYCFPLIEDINGFYEKAELNEARLRNDKLNEILK